MIEVNGLSRDELIANLWLTDEMINEMEIIKCEIEKKKHSLASTIATTEQEYLQTVEKKYYASEEYKRYQDYQELLEKVKDFHIIAILIDLIISVLFSYLLIFFNTKFPLVVFMFLILASILYVGYRFGSQYYLKQKKVNPIQTLEEVINNAKMNDDYKQISNSLLANHIRSEIQKLAEQLSQLEVNLIEKTVLPEVYRMRAKEVVWYLENLMADNLKEALAALVDADHRKQVRVMIEEQNQEIDSLKDRMAKLKEENQQLALELKEQANKISELENKKK